MKKLTSALVVLVLFSMALAADEWHIETVDGTGSVGLYSSIALDSSDYPHISYYDHTNDNLKYAYYDGSSWHFESPDTVGIVGYHTSTSDSGRAE